MIMKNNKCNGFVINSQNDQVLIKEVKDKSFLFPVKTESGVVRPKGITYQDDLQEYNEAFSIIGIGEVITIGPKCSDIYEGDFVMYDVRAARPVPIKFDWDKDDIPSIRSINASNVMCVVRKDGGK